jgi:hypothetical protein
MAYDYVSVSSNFFKSSFVSHRVNLRDKELQDMLTNIPGEKTRLHNRQKIIGAIKDLK